MSFCKFKRKEKTTIINVFHLQDLINFYFVDSLVIANKSNTYLFHIPNRLIAQREGLYRK